MKKRICYFLIYSLLVGGFVLSLSSLAFSDNKVEISISDASLIAPDSDSLSSRMLFKFDLPLSLNDKRIDFAEVVFYAKMDSSSTHSIMLAAYPVTTDWNKSSASWSNPWTNSGGDYNDSLCEIGLVKSSGEERVRLEITHFVERWQKQSMANYGLIVFPLETDRKIMSLVHHPSFDTNVYAKVIIYYSYTHP
jgi:hypothetical protein